MLRCTLVCIDVTRVDERFTPFHFGARRIQAALLAAGAETTFVEAYTTDVDSLLERIEASAPELIGFSAYVWSLPTMLEVTRRLRARGCKALILFGGPSARPAMLDLPEYRDARTLVDALAMGHAEAAAVAVAAEIPLADIPGLALPHRDGWRNTMAVPAAVLDALASPYRMGLAPPERTASLETFRGCPLSCSFCEWGVMSSASSTFSEETLVAELEAIRDTGADTVFLVDAGLNLNRRAFRQLAAAERKVRLFRDASFACEAYATQVREEDLAFLSECKIHHVGIGLQSFDPDVLRRLQRPFDERRFLAGVHSLASVAPCAVEIILGLPFDGPRGFRETLARARDLPVNVFVYPCLVLPDGLMTRAPEGSAIDFDPYTLELRSAAGWSERDLRTMRDELDRLAEDTGGKVGEGYWTLGGRERTAPAATHLSDIATAHTPEVQVETTRRAPPGLVSALAEAVERATQGGWQLLEAELVDEGLSIRLMTGEGALDIQLLRPREGRKAFKVIDGVAASYRPLASGAAPVMTMLEPLFVALAPLARRATAVHLPVVSTS